MEPSEVVEVVRKKQLDAQVAELLGRELREVSAITAAFLLEVRRALVEEGCVRMDGLGELHVNRRKGVRPHVTQLRTYAGKTSSVRIRAKYYVNFKKAEPLRAAIRAHYGAGGRKETTMEKFGVDESADKDLEKQASEGCPKCGSKPQLHGKVLICPNCGSEPFENPKK